jgi:dTDP-4-amino-4,6-dideoxygalactose transaminase
MLRLSLPHLDEAAIAAAVQVLRSGQLVHGAQGQAFEQELQTWMGCRHAVLVSSGTAALHLSLVALGIGPGDAVLVPDFTFPATANAVLLVGARPVLVDVDPNSYNVTPDLLDEAVAAWHGPERLRAVMPVHEFGCPVEMAGVRALAQRHSLAIVEDAACAIGALVDGRHAGTLGDVGCISLHPRKTLTTGEGGALMTDDDALANRLRLLRNHGIERGAAGAQFLEAGFNYRLTDFQSALGRAQLPHLEQWIQGRRELAAAYRLALQPLAERARLVLPADHAGHSWQTFMIVLADDVDRTTIIERLKAEGIEAGLGAQCLSSQPAFRALATGPSHNAMRLYAQGVALPFCEQYGDQEVRSVVAALERALH